MSSKKTSYVKIDEKNPAASKSRKPTGWQIAGKSLAVVGIITVCIVAVGLTVYVMQFAENSFDISLEDVELSFSTFIYANDADGNQVTIKQLNSDENRVWVDFEDIPDHVVDAVISVEDERFLDHEGVDWQSTFKVAAQAVFSGGTAGGSTITQQLVRDITGDSDVNIGRKLREIFRALAMEQKYTKQDILESYLNRIAFGGTSYGIASASLRYFDKEVQELTVAEAAILAGIIRSPSRMNPYADLEKARERQEYALWKMYENGYISTAEYEAALAEQVKFRLPVKGDAFGYIDERYNEYYGIQDESDDDLYYQNVDWDELVETTEAYKWNGDYEVTVDWYTDAAIKQVTEDLAELKGITYEAASTLLKNGGFSIYLNVDMEMQAKVTELFEDPYTVVSAYNVNAEQEDLLQATFVIMNYNGEVLAVAGGLGEKQGDDCFNRATQSMQVIGSTVKPLSVYSLGIETNAITYSSMLRDISGKVPAYSMGADYVASNGYDPKDDTVRWPHNYEQYDNFGTGAFYPAWYAVRESTNTIAVKVMSMVGLQTAYTHLTEKLGFDTLDGVNDMAYSPLALGAFTNGLPLVKLAAAYAPIGNGGLYYEPYFYSQVLDSEGKVVLSQNSVGTQAISSDTAWITNRMMKTVIAGTQTGSGRHAQLENIEVVGKTGTANDMSALLFTGLTPSYVASYRVSFDDNREITSNDNWITLAKVWNKVMSSVCDTSYEQNFTADPNVVVVNYCALSGLIATDECPNTEVGYYRRSNIPNTCDATKAEHEDEKGSLYWKNHGDKEIPFYG